MARGQSRPLALYEIRSEDMVIKVEHEEQPSYR